MFTYPARGKFICVKLADKSPVQEGTSTLKTFFCFFWFLWFLWFLSKKGPKEGERVARGHFHERVGESPVHWLPPGVGFTQKAFSVSENGPFENFLRSNSIFI